MVNVVRYYDWGSLTALARLQRARIRIQAHDVAEDARHNMLHAVPKLTSVTVHVDPGGLKAGTKRGVELAA